MILTKAYDVEILPNFFSITIIDLGDYLKVFKDVCKVDGRGRSKPVPLTQLLTVAQIKERLATVKSVEFYITDTDDSQLIDMLGYLNSLMPYVDEKNERFVNHLYGYNSGSYDMYMVAALLMFATHTNTTKELITKLYDVSKSIIELQNTKDGFWKDYTMRTLRKYKLPYADIDVMKVFALNKVGSGVNSDGEKVYFGKGLKQTSINLQWFELLEYELPPISELDEKLYHSIPQYRGLTSVVLNKLIDKWDRFIIPEWIPEMMRYNKNDVYIVCEMVRLYIDEIRLRYSISKSYNVNVLSSSRSNISDRLIVKFYSEFSGLHPKQWQGKKTERTAMAFKKVIFDVVKFKTPYMQKVLEEMKKVIIYSIGKDSFTKEIKINNLTYTLATGGIHSKDIPGVIKSKTNTINNPETGKPYETHLDAKGNVIWNILTDDSYVYIHWDIASFYPFIMAIYGVAPAHLDKSAFVKFVTWIATTRIDAKHSDQTHYDGIPKDLFVEVLKIVINALYGKLGFEMGDLYDRLAVLKVTINGQLLIMMLCEELEMNNIEVISANTDGIDIYVRRDINNYAVREQNGSITYKGALHPKMYAIDLSKGYDMPIVGEAVSRYFLENKPIMNTLYESTNILDFCKTQNVGRQYHVEFTDNKGTEVLQRSVRFYVSNRGGRIEKVSNAGKSKSNLCAGQRVNVLNTLNDEIIERRDINYAYYYQEAVKIIDPIKLGISASTKGDKAKGTASGKALIKKYSGMYNTLFDDNED